MKTIAKIVMFTALVSTITTADFLKIEMGAGMYSSTPSGQVSYTESGITANDISTEKDTTNPYVWAYIKHPVPILPNIRLEYSTIETSGIADGKFEDFTASGSPTQLDIKQYDVIPYYNLLDNTAWLTLDVGLDIKFLDTSYTASGVNPDVGFGTTYSDSAMLVLPLVYTRVRLEIPATELGIEADAKFVKYSSTTVYDARIKVDYTLDFVPVVQPAIEIGYRIQKYEIDEDTIDGKANLEFSGIYVGAIVRF